MAKAPAQMALAGGTIGASSRHAVKGRSSNEPWTLALALGITESGRCKGQPSASTLTLALA